MQVVSNPTYPAGLSESAPLGPGLIPGPKLPQVVAPTPAFMPSINSGFVQKHGMAPGQAPSPKHSAQLQPMVTPPAPPPTVQTVDTSNVSGNLKFPLGVKISATMVLEHCFKPVQ